MFSRYDDSSTESPHRSSIISLPRPTKGPHIDRVISEAVVPAAACWWQVLQQKLQLFLSVIQFIAHPTLLSNRVIAQEKEHARHIAVLFLIVNAVCTRFPLRLGGCSQWSTRLFIRLVHCRRSMHSRLQTTLFTTATLTSHRRMEYPGGPACRSHETRGRPRRRPARS